MRYHDYEGPWIRFDDPINTLALIPFGGVILALGSLAYLIDVYGVRETTTAPAKARGAVVVSIVTHAVYAALAVILWL